MGSGIASPHKHHTGLLNPELPILDHGQRAVPRPRRRRVGLRLLEPYYSIRLVGSQCFFLEACHYAGSTTGQEVYFDVKAASQVCNFLHLKSSSPPPLLQELRDDFVRLEKKTQASRVHWTTRLRRAEVLELVGM